jgi:hypothetical protein
MEKRGTENVCFGCPYNFFPEKFCSKKIHRNIIIHVHKSSSKVSDILVKILI